MGDVLVDTWSCAGSCETAGGYSRQSWSHKFHLGSSSSVNISDSTRNQLIRKAGGASRSAAFNSEAAAAFGSPWTNASANAKDAVWDAYVCLREVVSQNEGEL